MTSQKELMDRVHDVARRASLLKDPQGEFDVVRFLEDVRGALTHRNIPAAETILVGAEAKLDSIEARVPPQARSGSGSIRDRIAKARGRLFSAVRGHPLATDFCVLAAVAACWIVVLVWIQIQIYASFQILPDISVFNQVLYSTSHAHSLLFYSADLPGGNNGQFFSVHFSPFLFALVPIYYFVPGILTLLVIKQTALALGVFPAYALARAKLGSRAWAWILAGVYLSTPLITGLDWANFDMESFIPVALLSTLYFFETGRLRWFLVSSAIALSLIESVAPLLALFAIVVLVGTLIPLSRRNLPINQRVRKFAGWALCLSVVSLGLSYLFLAVLLRSPGGGSLGSGFSASFSVLGATSIPDIPLRVLLHPADGLAALTFDGSSKVLYILLLFGCVAFLPFFGELKYLVPTLTWLLGIALLSNAPLYFSFSDHMLAYTAPFLIVGAITGIRRVQIFGPRAFKRLGLPASVRSRWKPRWNPYVVGSILTAGLLVTVAVASPWNAHPLGTAPEYSIGVVTPTTQDADLSRVLAYLPSSASVLTTSVIFAAVSSRKAAFVEPTAGVPFLINWTSYNPSAGGVLAFHRVTEWYLNMSQYVVLDSQIDPMATLAVLYFGNNLTGYGVVAADQGAVLYERGWTSAPELWIPEQTTLAVHQSASNSSVYTTKAYHGLLVGEYSATFWWGNNATASGGTLKVTVKEVPVAIDANVKFETAGAVKYALGLNLTGGPAATNKTTASANGSVQVQLGFPESLSFSISESRPIGSTLLAVVMTQEMPYT